MFTNRSHIRYVLTNTKKLMKRLARIEASSICCQQFANMFADCFCAIHAPGRHSLIWVIRGRAAGQGMFFWPHCPKQGIQFDLPLPYTGSEPVLNRVIWYHEPRDFNPNCEHGLMVFCLIQVQRRNNWVLHASSIISLI